MVNVIEILKNKNAEIYKLLDYKTMTVTGCSGILKKEFDREGQAKRCSEKGYNDPKSKYYQMTPEMIIESWTNKSKESCRYGGNVDDYIGMVLNHEYDKLDEWKLDNSFEYNERLKSLCKGFDQFYAVLTTNTDYVYVAREEKMFIKSNKTGQWINGRFDCLFYSPSSDKYMIIDWKTSGKIETENNWEKLQGPLYEYDACNLNEYTVQVQMYKKALCEIYNITTPDKVDTYICQFATESINGDNFYKLYKPGFEYKSERLDDVIEFAYKKKAIQEAKKMS